MTCLDVMLAMVLPAAMGIDFGVWKGNVDAGLFVFVLTVWAQLNWGKR